MPFFFALLSAGIAWAAWHSLWLLPMLLFLPAILSTLANRLQVWSAMFVYFAIFARDIPFACANFFPDWPTWWGYSLLALDAAILASVFLVFNPKAAPGKRFAMMALALALLSVPPVGLFGWGNPLFVAGALFPGWSWAGLLAALVLLAAIAALSDPRARAIAGVLLLLAVVANVRYQAPSPPEGGSAVSTNLGGPFPVDVRDRAKRTFALVNEMRKAVVAGASVVLLPESVAGPWRDAVGQAFGLAGGNATVLIGAQVPIQGARYLNALVTPNGRVAASSRLPMPVGDWNPRGAVSDVFGSDLVMVAGRQVAVSLCYEDFVLWPHRGLIGIEGRGKVDVLLSAANDWSISGRDAVTIQRVSAEALARAAGVGLVRAVNL